MSAADSLCTFLGWDSDFFGRRIARLNREQLDDDVCRAALDWCAEQAIDCLYLLADSAHAPTTRMAEDNGFRLVDLRVTLETRQLSQPELIPTPNVRPGSPDDGPALRAIAGVSHRDSRFYFDPHFPDDRCDALYETWIVNSLNGYADAVLVALDADRPAGYITCHRNRDTLESGSIGLLAVAEASRGLGLGAQLIDAARAWFAAEGMSTASVVTQGRNAGAQRTYQRRGFVTRSVQLWYHRWFNL